MPPQYAYGENTMTEDEEPAGGLLSFEMTIAEWLGTAAMLVAPYLLLGVLWAVTHTGAFETAHGPERVLVFVRTVVFWPMLLLTSMCLP
jgi:hypothetical protein